jgi:hypothetical protein
MFKKLNLMLLRLTSPRRMHPFETRSLNTPNISTVRERLHYGDLTHENDLTYLSF